MNRYTKRLDAIEPAIRDADAIDLARRVATATTLPVDELLSEARRIAHATDGMTEAERLAWVAADAGCTVDELRSDMERLLA